MTFTNCLLSACHNDENQTVFCITKRVLNQQQYAQSEAERERERWGWPERIPYTKFRGLIIHALSTSTFHWVGVA